MNEYILTAIDVDFGYTEDSLILRDFNFSLKRGDFSGFIGPSGAGKTTIFRVLSGYSKVSAGDIKSGGRSIYSMNGLERSRLIGVVPQNLNAPLPYTVRQIVEMGRISRLPKLGTVSPTDREKIEEAMEHVNIQHMRDRLFSNLSGGEKQRAAIAMAIAQEPEILLLDEPTSSLDIGCTVRLMGFLKELNERKGITIVIISHDIQLAASWCSHLAIISKGTIVEEGAPDFVIRPELIETSYGCKVEILNDSRGRPMISAL